MLIFPSNESKTDYTSPPWVSIILSLLAIGGYLWLVLPLEKKYEQDKERAQKELSRIVSEDYGNGKLAERIWLDFLDDPEIVGGENTGRLFSNEARKGWLKIGAIPRPIEQLESDTTKRLLLALIPHDPYIMILGVICLLLQGFLFEHLYDRQVLLSFFVVSGCLWLTLTPYVPGPWWPSPVFAWSFSIAVLSLIIWGSATNAYITITCRTWFFKVLQFKPDIHTMIFPLLYLVGFYLLNTRVSGYSDLFVLQTMAAIPVEAVVFLLILMVVPSRDAEIISAETLVNRSIATAEAHYTRENPEAARAKLKDLLAGDLSRPQIEHIADLAWRFFDDEVARQAYAALLRDVSKTQDFHKIIHTIEDVLEKDIPLPASTLNSAVQVCLKRNMLDEVRKLIPYLADKGGVGNAEILDLWEELGKRLLVQPLPTKDFLIECKNKLEAGRPDSEVVVKLQSFFRKMGEANNPVLARNDAYKIQKHVQIDILEISSSIIHIKVHESKEQKIPWAAVEGIFGCHMATDSQRGFQGSILIKFKRKIFACNFTREGIMLKDPLGEPMGFELLWEELKNHAPEDIPFTDMENFEQFTDASRYPEAVQDFIKR